MQGTSQQEKMAGNVRDRNLAFQAAEAALRQAINTVMANGFVMPPRESVDPGTANMGDPNAYNWGAATIYAGALSGISAPPRYIIRWVKGLGAGSGLSATYRVTARGQGGTTEAVVVLQATVNRGD